VNPAGVEEWLKQRHPNAKNVLDRVLRRPPLVVLAGDVGSGKTELAETIGDAVARQESIDVTLFPLSLAARGKGLVGDMTRQLSEAFDLVTGEARKLKSSSRRARGAVILLVDEADAIAQSREEAQMHHEDRAGVNAFIRGIDRIAAAALPCAVLLCTNRPGALDPAVRRRAADILLFSRPDEVQRHAVLAEPLEALGFTSTEISSMVALTGPQPPCPYGLTFSDLTQRLLPAIVLDAYPDRVVNAERALEIARGIVPTAPFEEQK
jgi:AAA+ superfamily predicted ATPase